MTRWTLLASVVGAMVAATALVPAAARAGAAQARMRSAQAEHERVSRRIDELARLRAATPSWIARERPGGPLAPRVSAVLAEAGLGASVLQSLSGESAAPLVGNAATVTKTDLRAPIVRRRATLTLSGITLPQLGKFLAAWRASNPSWVPARIEVSPEPTGARDKASASTGTDLTLRAVLGLEAVYLDQAGSIEPETLTPRAGHSTDLSGPERAPASAPGTVPRPKPSSSSPPKGPRT